MAIIDVIGQILWFTGLPVAVVGALYVHSKMSDSPRKDVAGISALLSLLALFYLTSFGIVLRDGMALGVVVSTGWESVARTLPSFATALLVSLVVAIPGLVVFARKRRNSA